MRTFLVFALAGALCSNTAMAGEPQISGPAAPAAIGAFVRHLPLGTAVKLTLDTGRKLRGTLIGVEDDAVTVKVRTRIPEPPQRVMLAHIADADVERDGSMGKAVAIGAGVGAGSALGVLMMIMAIFSD
jgi:hypothetical protein